MAISNYSIVSADNIVDVTGATTSITVLSTAETTLTVTESASSNKILKGYAKPLIFTIDITNTGGAATDNVQLTNVIDTTQLNFVSVSPASLSYSDGVISGDLGIIDVGNSITVKIVTSVI